MAFMSLRKIVVIVFLVSFIFALAALDSYAASDKALDFPLEDLAGKQVRLFELMGKERTVLFFWTTWCPHCQSALRSLNKKSAKFKLVTINIGEPKERIEMFFKKNGYNFTVLLDKEGDVAFSYGVFGIPEFIVIEPDKHISYRDNLLPVWLQ
jgi:peroxiredoxin